MFISIIEIEHGHSTLIECQEVVFNRLQKNDYIPLEIDIKQDGVFGSRKVDPKVCDFYVMNNKGETIESYRWATHYQQQNPKPATPIEQ